MTTAPKPSPPSPPLLSPAALVRVRSQYEHGLNLWARAKFLAPHSVAAEHRHLAYELRDTDRIAWAARQTMHLAR